MSRVFAALLLMLLSSQAVCPIPAFASPEREKAVDRGHAGSGDRAEPKPKPPIQSFSRFEPGLRDVCRYLTLEGRHARVYELAVSLRKEERKCLPCRAWWASLANACRPPKTPVVTSKKIKKKVGDEEGGDGAEEPTPTPTPSPVPQRRYPHPSLLDSISKLVIAINQFDEGGESAKNAVENFVTTLLEAKDISPGERDYYEIIGEYFVAPWRGLPATPTPISEEDVDAFFE